MASGATSKAIAEELLESAPNRSPIKSGLGRIENPSVFEIQEVFIHRVSSHGLVCIGLGGFVAQLQDDVSVLEVRRDKAGLPLALEAQGHGMGHVCILQPILLVGSKIEKVRVHVIGDQPRGWSGIITQSVVCCLGHDVPPFWDELCLLSVRPPAV